MGGLREEDSDHLLDPVLRAASPSPAFRLSPAIYSKDAILAAAYEHAPWMYWVGVLHRGHDRLLRLPRAVPGLLRRISRDIGETRSSRHGHDDHGHGGIHESPPSMWIPLAILAALSLGGGFINIPKFLEPMFPLGRRSGESEWLDVRFRRRRPRRHRARRICSTWSRPPFPTRWRERSSRSVHAGSTTSISSTSFTTRPWSSPMVDGSRTLLWRAADVGRDRRHGERRRQDRARHRRHC